MTEKPPEHLFTGACHCEAIRVRYQTRFPIETLRVGRCGCSFCRGHGARTSSDAGGKLEIFEKYPGAQRYRFAYGITKFLVCRGCGSYVAAVMETEDGYLATLNVNVLDARDQFDPAPPLVDYDSETAAERRARRRRQWTPTEIVEAR
ncbi:MAG: aldehyde-activating protein [Pseudomonadota bacterium]